MEQYKGLLYFLCGLVLILFAGNFLFMQYISQNFDETQSENQYLSRRNFSSQSNLIRRNENQNSSKTKEQNIEYTQKNETEKIEEKLKARGIQTIDVPLEFQDLNYWSSFVEKEYGKRDFNTEKNKKILQKYKKTGNDQLKKSIVLLSQKIKELNQALERDPFNTDLQSEMSRQAFQYAHLKFFFRKINQK